MPTELLYGRYLKIPPEQRIYICKISVEDHSHRVMVFPLYLEPRCKFLTAIIDQLHNFSATDKVKFMLSDVDPRVSYRVALFALAARKIRAKVAPRKTAK